MFVGGWPSVDFCVTARDIGCPSGRGFRKAGQSCSWRQEILSRESSACGLLGRGRVSADVRPGPHPARHCWSFSTVPTKRGQRRKVGPGSAGSEDLGTRRDVLKLIGTEIIGERSARLRFSSDTMSACYQTGLPSGKRKMRVSPPLTISRARIRSAPSCLTLEPLT